MTQCLIFLAIIPVVCWQLAKKDYKDQKFFLLGLSFGLVVAPVSQGVLEFAVLPVIGGFFGGLGLVFNVVHGSVGYLFLTCLGVFEQGVLSGGQILLMSMVNGALWVSYYGYIGYRLDLRLAVRPSGNSGIFRVQFKQLT